MTAYELRRHIHKSHGVRLHGLDYGTLLTFHDVDHRSPCDHEHEDGPGSTTWAAECREFGCDEAGATRVAVLEYMVLGAIVFLAAWLYVLAGR